MLRKLMSLMIIIILLTTGCASKDKQNTIQQEAKTVKVLKAEKKNITDTIKYIGFVTSKDLKKYSFKVSGKLEKVFVEEGQVIKKGEKIAQIESSDLVYAVESAKAQLESANALLEKAIHGASKHEINQAKLSVEKAEKTYQHTKGTFEKLKVLYENGAISEQNLKKANLEVQMAEIGLNKAQEVYSQLKNGPRQEDVRVLSSQLEQARINHEQKLSILENSTIVSDIDGYVAKVLTCEGEMVAAGQPVAIVRDNKKIVKVGLSQEDISKVYVGLSAEVKKETTAIKGKIVNVSQIPVDDTMTYPMEIELEEDTLPMGAIVEVSIPIRRKKAISIPINSIMNDGKDYVYVVKDSKVLRKDVEIQKTTGNNVLVKGISQGDYVIIEGIKNLKTGNQVKILH